MPKDSQNPILAVAMYVVWVIGVLKGDLFLLSAWVKGSSQVLARVSVCFVVWVNSHLQRSHLFMAWNVCSKSQLWYIGIKPRFKHTSHFFHPAGGEGIERYGQGWRNRGRPWPPKNLDGGQGMFWLLQNFGPDPKIFAKSNFGPPEFGTQKFWPWQNWTPKILALNLEGGQGIIAPPPNYNKFL